MENGIHNEFSSTENKENQESVSEKRTNNRKPLENISNDKKKMKENKISHPYKVIYNPFAGRSLVAAKCLSAGSLLIQEKPMVLGPTAASAPVCLSCHSPVSIHFRCPKCQWPMCSLACANQASHVEECHILAQDTKRIGVPINADVTPRYDLIVILRCLLLKDKDPKKWEILMSFENHWEKRKEDAESHHMAAVRYFTKVCPTGFDEETLHKVRGAIMTNCINSRCSSGISLRGLYPKISLLNHSCHPNISLRSDQNCQLFIHTSVPVEEGESVCFSYVPPGEPFWKRQRDLRDIYYFDCTCGRCSDKTELDTHFSALKCKKCTKSYIDPMHNKKKLYRCTTCRYSLPQVKMMHISIGLQNYYAREEDIVDVPSAMRVLKEIHNQAHGKHYTWLACAGVILRALARMTTVDAHRLRKQLWMRVIDIYSILEPGMTRRRGVSLLQLTSVSVLLAIQDYNLARISKLSLQKELEQSHRHLLEAAAILDLEPEDSTEARWMLMAEKEKRRLEEVKEQLLEMEKGEEFVNNSELFEDPGHQRRVKEIESLTESSESCAESTGESEADDQ